MNNGLATGGLFFPRAPRSWGRALRDLAITPQKINRLFCRLSNPVHSAADLIDMQDHVFLK